jgi:hypothetical protein
MSGDLPDEAKIRKDLLWGMYTDLRAHARHAETLRANVINVTIVVASVLVAVITNDGRVQQSDLPMCSAVIVVGLFGVAFAASYTELHERNRRRAMRFRDEMNSEFFTATSHTISSLLDEADALHRASALYRRARVLPGSTQRFWLLLPAFVVAAGVILATVAL